MVPQGSRVLDLGCWTGYFGRYLAARGCSLVGVERDARAAEIAGQHCEQVVCGDLNDPIVLDSIGAGFDAVLFYDILEHVVDAGALPTKAHEWTPSGATYVSLPNVAHWSIRKALLFGSWDYTDTGIMDRTHLKFYTERTAAELLVSNGWRIDWRGISAGALPIVRREIPSVANQLPSLFAVKFLFRAVPT